MIPLTKTERIKNNEIMHNKLHKYVLTCITVAQHVCNKRDV